MSSIEFDHLDLDEGFVQVPGKRSQISQNLLDTMGHNAKTGMRTRILRVNAGFQSFAQHDHTYWEELTVIKVASTWVYQATRNANFQQHHMRAASKATCMTLLVRMKCAI